jgi:1-acyl-sn-glycerol-3-phosphate acyltransferase
MNILKSIIFWVEGVGIIVLFFPVIFFVWLITIPFDKNRTITHWLLIYQAIIISYLVPIWKIKVEGREKVVAGTTYIIIANHQSILDILVLNCLRYRYKWISKIETLKVPVLGWYVKMADYITVDRGNKDSKEKMLEDAYMYLKKEISIMIFPEGTRSADKEIGFFKRGAFQLALSTDLPILPVLIDGTGGILPKHGIIFGGFHKITIKVFDPVTPDKFISRIPEELAADFQRIYAEKLKELRRIPTR